MQKIKSFTINHDILQPGVYRSRTDIIQNTPIITLDIRLKRPNVEAPLNTSEIHTIEHLAATYLRNHPIFKNDIIYFGPMGCRTGFYLLIQGDHEAPTLFSLIEETFQFIAQYDDVIPGATAIECGNYRDHDLAMAKRSAALYVASLQAIQIRDLHYLEA